LTPNIRISDRFFRWPWVYRCKNMIQINLVGKKRKQRAGKNWITLSAASLFIAFVLYFLGSAIYVFVRLTVINREIRKVDIEAESISKEIGANQETLFKYVLSKHILDRMADLKNERFRYKDYLDQISRFIPPTSILTNVDFTSKGWVSASVSLPGLLALRELENNLKNEDGMVQSEFRSVFSESLTSSRNGQYNIKLHFEIKPNGG